MAAKPGETIPDASKLMDWISDEMDLVFRVTDYPHRLRICPVCYQVLKEYDAGDRPAWMHELFYERDGHEYIRAVHNENIPFKLHYRVVIDNSLTVDDNCGTAVELDDEIEPGVALRAKRDLDDWLATVHASRRFPGG
jgi:hypothetical protein